MALSRGMVSFARVGGRWGAVSTVRLHVCRSGRRAEDSGSYAARWIDSGSSQCAADFAPGVPTGGARSKWLVGSKLGNGARFRRMSRNFEIHEQSLRNYEFSTKQSGLASTQIVSGNNCHAAASTSG